MQKFHKIDWNISINEWFEPIYRILYKESGRIDTAFWILEANNFYLILNTYILIFDNNGRELYVRSISFIGCQLVQVRA